MTSSSPTFVNGSGPRSLVAAAMVLRRSSPVGNGGRPGAGVCASWPLVLAVVLLLQFRLWDDLEDLERDRAVHPDRVLVRSDSGSVPLRLPGVQAITNILLLASAGNLQLRPRVSLVLTSFSGSPTDRCAADSRTVSGDSRFCCSSTRCLLACWRPLSARRCRGDCSLRAGAVYLCACAYETLHDRQLPLGATS